MSHVWINSGVQGFKTAAVFLEEGQRDVENMRNKMREILDELIGLAEHGDADLDENWNEALNRARSFLGREPVEFTG